MAWVSTKIGAASIQSGASSIGAASTKFWVRSNSVLVASTEIGGGLVQHQVLFRPSPGRVRPDLYVVELVNLGDVSARFGLGLGVLCRIRGGSGPNWGGFGPTWGGFGQIWCRFNPQLCHNGQDWGGFGPLRGVDTFGVVSAKLQLRSAKMGTFDQSWCQLGQTCGGYDEVDVAFDKTRYRFGRVLLWEAGKPSRAIEPEYPESGARERKGG